MDGALRTGPEGWHGEWEEPDSGSGVSIIFNRSEAIGYGPQLHTHPYAETFIVRSGTVRFTLGETTHVAKAGNIVVAPAGVPHRFENLGPEPLEMIDIHASPNFVTVWL
ncbi:cupin domain-containing protein [Pelagibacterium sp. 26DY04]|uniref:cupin domain-containing protein n=1 Tax=Pelagibacterium sp. 26DY04 TaxID=2967130 RepID=UPI0028155BDF|nr:cupin domain-containing protein [Pelagibacterium sp. 26DY04]WMT86959.1 cupin domain-containing protein [Pelagibacterium sp. 26DY04]